MKKSTKFLADALIAWGSSKKQLRFGQYVFNTYLSDTGSNPKLFYEKDFSVAYALAFSALEERYGDEEYSDG